jgi:hypothetical protein
MSQGKKASCVDEKEIAPEANKVNRAEPDRNAQSAVLMCK